MTTRRAWLRGGLALLAGPWVLRAGAGMPREERAVRDFDVVVWQAAGELEIEQTGRERLTVEAEPAVRAMITTEVRHRRLTIGFKPGRVVSEQAIRFHLEVVSLTALEAHGSGLLRIGPLRCADLSLRLAGTDTLRMQQLAARSLDAQLAGAGELLIDAGEVEHQRVAITGAANYTAPRLASRDAEVAIEGSGDMHIAVSDRLHARISGSGDVHYRGRPQLTESVSGAGAVHRED
jgi:hypothetical protein